MSRVHGLTDKGDVPCMNDQASSLLGVKKVGFKQHFYKTGVGFYPAVDND